MAEPNGSEERNYPMDIYALQPATKVDDPNQKDADNTWNEGERWTVIYDVVDLVRHVKHKCGAKFYVRHLRIGGHGNDDRFRLGNTLISKDQLTSKTGTIITSVRISDLKPWLEELIPYLIAGKSLIILDHCYVGKNDALLKELSDAFGGIPVIAPFDGQISNEGIPQLEGDARICNSSVCMTVEEPNNRLGV